MFENIFIIICISIIDYDKKENIGEQKIIFTLLKFKFKLYENICSNCYEFQ